MGEPACSRGAARGIWLHIDLNQKLIDILVHMATGLVAAYALTSDQQLVT